MSWEDDLKAKLETPEEQQAEADRKKRDHHAEGFRAVSHALSQIRKTLLKAQLLLAGKYGPSMGVKQEGDDSTFEVPGHKLSAKRSDDGTVLVLTCDGKVTRFVYRSGGTFAADGVVPVGVSDFDEIVGSQVSSFAAP